ncbi:hypothetical protein PLESTB_000260600 [Pleodorina starrii]|uniref:DUS-like FMN-binding domain-containing protein n=1 Tax=Pleodorina starrii TaxID=330485 RepID=A0A9W6BCJ5_9CHLO|nr:hypothetical protein PLESTM_000690400 [Pleodorina starrii]GLC49579.1 hypothetical protein PLESTB_000260600 [Pleodorina starrii]GLC65631.1 hypothetical protein PLESTF_000320900 [Pleodorina starrii]
MDYNGKLILAPMVRVGTHPMRLLAAGYGADIVYSEELVDKRVIASMRRINAALGTIDFLDKGGEQGGRLMFRTTPSEQPRLVFQLGTADGATALAAASVVAADVACVDVNMGCPKQFSLQGGMGAALLKKPEVAEDILKTLRRNLQLPVSCKIRLLDDPRDTVELARRLAACGISALAVHGRTTQQRPRDPADWARIRLVVDALGGAVPVIANGDIMSYDDAQRVRQETGCAAAMVARAAMWNASVFRPQGFLPLDHVQREYVRLAVRWGNALPNTKYCLKEMADAPLSFAGRWGGDRTLVGHEANTAITRARDERQMCALVGVADEPPYQDLDPSTSSLLAASAHSKGAAKSGPPRSGGGGGDRPSKHQQQQQAARKRARNGAVLELPPQRDQPPAAASHEAAVGAQQRKPLLVDPQQAEADTHGTQGADERGQAQDWAPGPGRHGRGASGTAAEAQRGEVTGECRGDGAETAPGCAAAGAPSAAERPGWGLTTGVGSGGGGRCDGDGGGGREGDGGETEGGGGVVPGGGGDGAAVMDGAGDDGWCLKRPRRQDSAAAAAPDICGGDTAGVAAGVAAETEECGP